MKKRLCVLLLSLCCLGGLFAQIKNSPVVGEWIYRGKNETCELEFDRDGDATIEVYSAGTKFEWEGTWTVSNDEIVFNVNRVEFENKSFGQKEERKAKTSQIFRITFSIVNGKLTITCPDLPQDITSGLYERYYD